MVEQKDGDKQKQQPKKGSHRKHKVSSGAGAKQAKRRAAYLAKRTARFGLPFDRMKRKAKRGGGR